MQYFIDNGWSDGGETSNAYVGIDEDLIKTRVTPAIQAIWKEYNVEPCSASLNGNDLGESLDSGKCVACAKSKINEDYLVNVVFASSYRHPSNNSQMDELREYEKEETEPIAGGPYRVFNYWALRSSRWPKLSAMAKDLLSIPATSAASERAFSTGKDIFGIARMSLHPETVEAFVVKH
ncbi:hypothetical protein OUZ56_029742 [Daphnia magna]|nr:hypothetical protein OUZ56_029742 [Daphnia magna]